MIDLTKPIRPKPGHIPATVVWHDDKGAVLLIDGQRDYYSMRLVDHSYENIPPEPQYGYVAIFEDGYGCRVITKPYKTRKEANDRSKLEMCWKRLSTRRIELSADAEGAL